MCIRDSCCGNDRRVPDQLGVSRCQPVSRTNRYVVLTAGKSTQNPTLSERRQLQRLRRHGQRSQTDDAKLWDRALKPGFNSLGLLPRVLYSTTRCSRCSSCSQNISYGLFYNVYSLMQSWPILSIVFICNVSRLRFGIAFTSFPLYAPYYITWDNSLRTTQLLCEWSPSAWPAWSISMSVYIGFEMSSV